MSVSVGLLFSFDFCTKFLLFYAEQEAATSGAPKRPRSSLDDSGDSSTAAAAAAAGEEGSNAPKRAKSGTETAAEASSSTSASTLPTPPADNIGIQERGNAATSTASTASQTPLDMVLTFDQAIEGRFPLSLAPHLHKAASQITAYVEAVQKQIKKTEAVLRGMGYSVVFPPMPSLSLAPVATPAHSTSIQPGDIASSSSATADNSDSSCIPSTSNGKCLLGDV